MKINKILGSLLGILTAAIPGLSVQAANTPRLVVGIQIDQLNADYLEWFMDGFNEDGFRKLFQGGVVYKNMTYDYHLPDAASAAASIASGTVPANHGIIGSKWFDRKLENVVSCIEDENYLGNYTKLKASPKKLLCSTLADELKQSTNGTAKVFSVGISPEEAIMSAGHTADGVFWIDDETGKWSTTTYYNYMPWWIQNINDTRDMQEIVDKTSWQPLYPLSYYKYMPYQTSPTLFQYWLNKYGKNKIRAFKQTPVVNTEVAELAIQTIQKEKLGTDEVPDLLLLNFTASGNFDSSVSMSAVEIQDIYFRLDQEIGKILDIIERQAGFENTLIYLTGTGQPQNPAIAENKKAGYAGSFYPERCKSLLNLYLMAIYGNEKWVSGYHNQNIYLNRKLIESKGVSYDEISRKTAEFLGEFSGVQRVKRNRELLSGDFDISLDRHRNSISFDRSGDIYIEIQPGWNIINNSDEYKDLQVRYESYNQALVFFGNKLEKQTVYRAVSSGNIASTLSKIFKIRPPNSSSGNLLTEIK